MKNKPPAMFCSCGSGIHPGKCCDPLINHTALAPTVEALMRSRYTAYTRHDERYLRETWHSTTRPDRIELDPAIHWLRLEIVHSSRDRVEFIATYRINGKAHKLRENSRFTYEDGRWFYLDGDVKTG